MTLCPDCYTEDSHQSAGQPHSGNFECQDCHVHVDASYPGMLCAMCCMEKAEQTAPQEGE